MQKPIGGRSVMALFTAKGMQKKIQPTYKGGGIASPRASAANSGKCVNYI